MKSLTILSLLILVFSFNSLAQFNWTSQSSGTSENLNEVWFADSSHGIVIGDNGVLLTTIDGGDNWTKKNLSTNENLIKISFVDKNNGVVLGENQTYFSTTDGGQSWIDFSNNIPDNFECVDYFDIDKGVAVGGNADERVVFKTVNGGSSWVEIGRISGYEMYTPLFIHYHNPQTTTIIFSFTSQTAVLQSIDGGVNWELKWTSPFYSNGNGFNDAEFISNSTGFLVGNDAAMSSSHSYVYRTVDGGITWSKQTSATEPKFKSAHFINKNKGFAVGNSEFYPLDATQSAFFNTADQGVSWDKQVLNSTYVLNDVFFIDSLNGTIVGDNGLILRSSKGGAPDPLSIQELINIANPNDTIRLNENQYYECFTIKKPITLIGSGLNQTKIIGDTLKPVITIFSTDVSIENITIHALTKTHHDEPYDCNKHTPTNGMEISNSTNVLLNNVKILGGEDTSTQWNISGGDGLVINGSENISVHYSVIIGANANNFDTYSCAEENGGDGLEINNSTSINIINSTIKGGRGGNGYSHGAGPSKGGYGGNGVNLNHSSDVHTRNSHLIGGIGGKTASSSVEYREQAKAGDGAYCSDTKANFLDSILEGGEALINIPPHNVPLNTLGGNGITAVNNSKIHINGGVLIPGTSSEDALGKQYFIDSTSSIQFSNIDVDTSSLHKGYSLEQNYPNPFNPTTKIKFNIASEAKQPVNTTLKIYDILGREIITLLNKPMLPGEYEIEFDGSELPSGVYIYRLTSSNFNQTRKMVLIK